MAPFGIALLDPATFIVQTINGIQSGFVLFLVASGLTVILGILDVLNLAHGELYALGAFVAWSVVGWMVGNIMQPPVQGGKIVFDPVGSFLFVGMLILGALIAAAILFPVGALIERVFLRPIYDRAEVYQLVLTFAILLVIADLLHLVWGSGTPRALSFETTLAINEIPTFSLVGLSSIPSKVALLIIVSAIVGGLLFYFFRRTKTGRIIRATAIDREMAQALGVNPDRTFTIVFGFGSFLAGFAGAMQMIKTSATTGMGAEALVLSFVVIVVGGLGSLRGAVVGALVVGIARNWMVVINPQLQTAAPFIIMVLVLLVKPEGLYGTWGERS